MEPRSLGHESQPLTIGPFLTLVVKYFYIFQCKYTIEDGKLVKTQQGKPYNTSKYMELNTDGQLVEVTKCNIIWAAQSFG